MCRRKTQGTWDKSSACHDKPLGVGWVLASGPLLHLHGGRGQEEGAGMNHGWMVGGLGGEAE